MTKQLFKLATIERTRGSDTVRWFGVTEHNVGYIYVEYKHGRLVVEYKGWEQWRTEILSVQHGGEHDGDITFEKMVELTDGILDFTDAKKMNTK